MKHTYTFILTMIMAISAYAKFNTITTTPKGIVRIETEKPKRVEPLVPDTVTNVSTNAQSDSGGERQKWIDQYLSVSLPLKEIKVTSPYGYRKDPFTGKQARHTGVDLCANYEDVYAMMIGRVEKVGHDKRSGNYVKIRHADYEVIYCHLSKVHVQKGQFVSPGETVATTGNTGRSTGPHLHYSLKYKGKHINPHIFLDYITTVQQEAIDNLSEQIKHKE